MQVRFQACCQADTLGGSTIRRGALRLRLVARWRFARRLSLASHRKLDPVHTPGRRWAGAGQRVSVSLCLRN